MSTITKSTGLFPSNLVTDVYSKTKGFSSLAALSQQEPIPFAGNDVMVFSMDGEASIVGEGENKPAGDADFAKKTITPIKIVYQHRLTDEFINMSEEKQLPYLQQFVDGFAKKTARAVDIMVFQGVNPADGVESAKIGTNCFAKAVANKVTYAAASADENLDDAVALIQDKDCDVTGIAMAPAFASALGKIKAAGNGTYLYPEFRFGNKPANFGGMANSVNNTVAFKNSKIRAVVGDFANAVKWGYAEQVPMKIIEYGDPDGQGDLQRTNQIVLRAETYVGFCVLDPDAFALITTESAVAA